MKVLLVHPGTQHSRQLALELYKRGILYQYWTGFALAESNVFAVCLKKISARMYKRISNRVIPELPSRKIKTLPLLEFKAIRALKESQSNKELILFTRNEAFQKQIPDNIIQNADVIIGFDTSSWILAERCKKFGKKFILDISIAHPASKERAYEQILKLYPDWFFTLNRKTGKLIQIEEQEMKLADKIVVASSFTQKTLTENGVSNRKIVMNPYGVDASDFHPVYNKQKGRTRFVFVGQVDARKGVPLLLDAWMNINRSEALLTLIGPISDSTADFIKAHYSDVEILGKVSFEELKRILPEYDVFVFVSYFEGFGLVILEAMACGLPVLTSVNTCGPDVLDNGKSGFIIGLDNAQELEEKMRYMIDHTDEKELMGKSARSKSELFTWDSYGDRWEKIIYEVANDK
ncbi:MAG: glycosyltransferase family 4 protein [Filimonas sp.]|nr:glycosyltransferase family 4 protein [Filimonas sp.]